MAIELKKLEANNYEAFSKNFDCHIRLEGEEWAVDVFRKVLIRDDDVDHVDSELFPSFQEALDYVLSEGWCEWSQGEWTPKEATK